MSKIGNALLTVEERFSMSKDCYEFFRGFVNDEMKIGKPDLYLADLASAYRFYGMMYAYADIQNKLLGDDKLIKIMDNIEKPVF